mgnify:CR=1 FL=1
MHLLPFILVGYVAVGVQVGLNGFVRFGSASPNVVLITAVFFALFLPREPGRLACFALGVMQDLLTQQTLGLYAIAYGLVGVVIGNSQAMVFRERTITHLAATLLGSALTWAVLIVHGWWFGPAPSLGFAAAGTLLTVAVTPLVFWPLMKLRPALGLRSARRF